MEKARNIIGASIIGAGGCIAALLVVGVVRWTISTVKGLSK